MIAIDRKDLSEGFRAAKEKMPKNVKDKVNKNIEKSYMMNFGKKKDNLKAWTLTSTGERYVESGFNRKK